VTGKTTVGEYLLGQLRERSVEHIFGVPGDFVLGFMDTIVKSPTHLINTCDEQAAGFAADAYARLRGMGAMCVTYGVGGLKVANPTAEAFAERSPVVVISGAPGLRERESRPMMHHKIRDYDTQRKVFEQITCASTVLSDPDVALDEIDRALATCTRHKRPVYIELPRDVAAMRARHRYSRSPSVPRSDPRTLEIAIGEATAMFRGASQPVVLAGEELHRFGLQQTFADLVHEARIPVAATILGKSVIDEDDPLFMGIYQGGIGREAVRRYVETSDCILMLGVMMTDMNLGIYTARLDRNKCIHAVTEKISVGYHVFEDVLFADFVRGLASARLPTWDGVPPAAESAPTACAETGRVITSERLFALIDGFLDETMLVIADPGDALFGAANLRAHRSTTFLSPAYYTSLGFAVPAAIGAQAAQPHLRPLVLVGDGAFQMTGMELSTCARFGMNPIVVVLNNRGYVTERFILDGPFNDVQPWDYSRVPEVIGAGCGRRVGTEDELMDALSAAVADPAQFHVIDVHLDPMDGSPALRRIAAGLAKRHA